MPEKKAIEISRVQREQFDKGNVALQKQSFDYCISIYQQVLAAEPGFYECRAALRAAQFKRAGGATGFFKKVIGGAASQPMLTKIQLTLRKNPAEALASLESILSGDPYNMGAHKLVVEAAVAADFPRTAILSAEILLKHSSKDRELMLRLAELLTNDGQISKAEAVYSEMLKINPNDPEAAQLAKNISARQTMSEGGYEKLAEGSGTYRDILKNKTEAASLEQEGRVLKTEDVAANLIREYEARAIKEPGNLKVLRNLAELLVQRKDFDRALEYYEKMRATDGGADSSLEKVIADLNVKKLDHQRAQLDPNAEDFQAQSARIQAEKQTFQLAECRRRAERYPNDLGIRFELGVLLFEADKIGEAIQEFQKAQNNPQRRLASMSYLGQCFGKRGMNDMAARKLQEALKEKLTFDEEKKDLIYALGSVLEKMGKKDEAIEQFKQIYEADIGYKDVAAKVDAYYAEQG